MLSSFIALAAGLIGSADATPPPAAPIIQLAPAEAEATTRQVAQTLAQEAADREEPAPVMPVQEIRPAPTVPGGESPDPDAPGIEVEPPSSPAGTRVLTPPAPGPQNGAVRRADPSVLSVTERRAVLKSASDAMSRVETAQGRFIQVDANGSLSEGEFHLQRPGRMRFDYDDPVPILIASDGVTVAMRDEELETVDRVPLGTTPLGLLLDDNLDFETEAEVIRVQRANGIVAITVVDPNEEAQGELTLIFNAGSYDLLAWRVLDANGGITTVELQDVRTGVSLNPRLFIIEDFEDEDDDRRR